VSADPRSEFVAAVIVPERDYLLRKLAEVNGAAYSQELSQNLTPADYQSLLDSDEHVKRIISAELQSKEEEFQLSDFERIAA